MTITQPTIAIIGTNRGIGLELVRQYLADNWKVIATCRQPQKATELLKLKEKYPQQLDIFPLEVIDAASRAAFAEKINNVPIDILLHNAGVYGDKKSAQKLNDLDEADWLRTLHINSIAPIKVTEALLPHLRRGKRKIIALMTSKMGSVGDNTSGGNYVYRSSKAALNMAGKSLATDLAADGFTVLLLHPGWVKTDMGGPNAMITPAQSVQGLRKIIDQAESKNTGAYLAYDGQRIVW